MRLFQTRPSRRTKTTQTLDRHQLLTFQIRNEWFALPLAALQRVVPMNRIHGQQGELGIGVARYEGQELLVIDVGSRLFPKSLAADRSTEHEFERHMIILQAPSGDMIGLPIDSRPTLKRVPASSLTALPPSYTSLAHVQCVSGMVILEDQKQSYFLLDWERLVPTPLLTADLAVATPIEI